MNTAGFNTMRTSVRAGGETAEGRFDFADSAPDESIFVERLPAAR